MPRSIDNVRSSLSIYINSFFFTIRGCNGLYCVERDIWKAWKILYTKEKKIMRNHIDNYICFFVFCSSQRSNPIYFFLVNCELMLVSHYTYIYRWSYCYITVIIILRGLLPQSCIPQTFPDLIKCGACHVIFMGWTLLDIGLY